MTFNKPDMKPNEFFKLIGIYTYPSQRKRLGRNEKNI